MSLRFYFYLLPQSNGTRSRDEECVTPKCTCFFGPIKSIKYHSRFPVTADKNLALAQKYYQLRFEELQQLILAEESAFKCVLCHFGLTHNLTHLRTILKEIEDIKAGKWEEQLKSQLTGQPSASQENLPADTVSLHFGPCLQPTKSHTVPSDTRNWWRRSIHWLSHWGIFFISNKSMLSFIGICKRSHSQGIPGGL